MTREMKKCICIKTIFNFKEGIIYSYRTGSEGGLRKYIVDDENGHTIEYPNRAGFEEEFKKLDK